MNKKYYEAVGRRKTAVARVRVTDDHKGHFIVNTLPLNKYFALESIRRHIETVLAKHPAGAKLSVSVKVRGGGINAQAEAVALGLARAFLTLAPELKPALRAGGRLTRDARMKERRKFGLKKARKAPQWSKR